MKNSKLIVVLGMHRSGTSVITRGLQVLGVNLGDRFLPPKGDNQKGFWEDSDINAINIEMLNAVGSDWHHLAAIEAKDIEILRNKGYFLRAVKMLHEKVGDAPTFAFKDPRVAKLMPFWQEVFSHCQFDVSIVMAIRHPLSVAKSLAARNGFDAEKSYLLWLGHVITSLTCCVGNKRVLVDYDRLMQSPDGELTRIAKCIDLKIDPAELQSYKTEFLDQGLRHTVYDLNDLLSDEHCPSIVREIYIALLDVASDKARLEDVALQNKIAHWSDEYERLKPPLLLIDRLFTQKAAAMHAVAERDGQITNLNQVMAERDGQIASLNQVVAERDGQITVLSHAAAERNMQMAGLHSDLDEIRRSRSWRLTAPLRYVGHHARDFKRIWLFFLQPMKLNGGLVSTARKVLRIYWREGRVGVKRRVLFHWKTSRVNLRSAVSLPVRLPEVKRKPQFQVDHLDSDSINYYGYIRAESGLGAACRGYIRALQHDGRKVCPINLPCGLREVEFPVQSTPNTSAMFNIVHMNADSIPYFFTQMGADCLDGRYNIGLWVWELAALNPNWFQSFMPFQEIWVPSEFCRQSVSAISPIPVYVIPHLVAWVGDEHTNHRGYFNLPENAFVFGYIFDCSSSIARKNPFALIEAFQQAFVKNENALLLLKMSNGERDPALYRRILEAIDRHPRILTIERSLDETELGWFFDALDCYVSPHRSEGFGLTVAEAMLAGKPVIATDYGGTTDFLKSEHAYPVRCHLVPIREQHGPYLPGYLWAEPDIDHLAERLREVYEHPEIARSRGEEACRFVNEQYSVDRVAGLMRDRFQEILRTTEMMRHE